MLTDDPTSTSRRDRFHSWRSTRPFWGGALLLLSGAFLLLPAFSSLKIGDVLVSISTIAGVSTLLLGSLMIVCAGAVLTNTTVRVPAGVTAMLIALVALPAANFGGFVIGTLLGVAGSAATLSWTQAPQASPEVTDEDSG